MGMFECGNDECKAMENTAYANYHGQKVDGITKPFCSACNPDIGEWHNKFHKRTQAELDDPNFKGPKGFVIPFS